MKTRGVGTDTPFRAQKRRLRRSHWEPLPGGRISYRSGWGRWWLPFIESCMYYLTSKIMWFVIDWILTAKYSLPLWLGLNVYILYPLPCIAAVLFQGGLDLGFAVNRGIWLKVMMCPSQVEALRGMTFCFYSWVSALSSDNRRRGIEWSLPVPCKDIFIQNLSMWCCLKMGSLQMY